MNRLHFFTTIGLALALGFTAAHIISMKEAEAYPSGASVSYGSVPLVSAAGSVIAASPVSGALTAPSDQAIVLTDVVLTPVRSSATVCQQNVFLSLGSGDVLGQYYLTSFYGISGAAAGQIQHSYSSGLVIPAGDTLDVQAGLSNCEVYFSISGYYAEP